MDYDSKSTRLRKSEDATATVISMLEENMRHLEEMEEEKIKMQQEHQEEKLRLEEQMEQLVDQWLEQKAKLEEEMDQEAQQMRKEMENFRSQCERDMAMEKEKMLKQAEEWKSDRDRMAQEKAVMGRQVEQCRDEAAAETKRMAEEKLEMTRKMEQFRAECGQKMDVEREQMSRKTSEFEAECERSMQEKEAEMGRKMAELRAEFEAKIQKEKLELAQKTAEFRAEEERLAQEKQQMRQQLDDFTRECERTMAAEKAETSRKTAEFQLECKRLEEEKEEMTRKMADFRKECDLRMEQEKNNMSGEMAVFRSSCEQKIHLSESQMTQRSAEWTAERERLERATADMRKRMEQEMAETERRLTEERQAMASKTAKYISDCEQKMIEKEMEMARQTELASSECEALAHEKEEMMREMAAVRGECERLEQDKQGMTTQMDSFKSECVGKMEEKEKEMARKTLDFTGECERLEREKSEMTKKMASFRTECEWKMVEQQAQLTKEMADFRAACERQQQEHEREMSERAKQFQAERERLAQEKVVMTKQMNNFRAECEQKISEEEERMLRMTADFRAESERKVAEEKAASDLRLAENRRHTEEQLRRERLVTEHIMNVLRELPPLQTAMELGDLSLLEKELMKWRLEALPERFGEGKGVVEAVVKLAKERVVTWRGVEHTWKDVLRQVERLPGSVGALTQQCQRLFRALKEAQLTKMDLRRSDPQAIERICEVFFVWQERAMCCSNAAQKAIVRKVVNWPQLGPFDFADLDICLRLVDRGGLGSDVFLSRAQALVEEEGTAPKEFRSLLSHVETMLFFLKYAASEDLAMTHAEFGKQSLELDSTVAGCLAWAARAYPPGGELVRLSANRALVDGSEAMRVLEEIRKPTAGRTRDSLGPFREIFYQWALAMRSRFDLLVLPHHTQVVCLLAFQHFLEAERSATAPHALVAQVGTGEGKSMIVAALAVYVVAVMGKKAHVVVDDETLLERDFWNFKRLFDAFHVAVKDGKQGAVRRPIVAVLCASEERVGAEGIDSSCMRPRVDPDADICYCEAKHVQSFYASIARGDNRDFAGYDDRVLILDEVDALVIDEEPNEAFVYPNQELSEMATTVAEALSHNINPHDVPGLQNSEHPATSRVVKEMSGEWKRGKLFHEGEDFVYSKELGKYCALQSGRVNPKAWSLALECRNFQEGFSRDILFQERMFVMSRPRVFRRYHRILGLSGSIGSKPERAFLKSTYRAAFFEVPPFLKTCRGSPFHEPVPVRLGERKQAVYVEGTVEAQIARLSEIALEARERVPVLVIGHDRVHADQVVEGLRLAARSRGLGGASEDVVRSLSRTLYEADAEQWKENLNRSTMPLGDNSGGAKSWRVTVTDPRGGRGTDYRVDDPDVDEQGGLLLITTLVPTSQREWIQFLGRTARQDRRGQFCAVLNSKDYESMSKRYNEQLPASGPGLQAISTVLGWGDRQVADKIQSSAALYNCGVRMNELCEEIFAKRPELLRDPAARERLVDVCQRHRWMSVREVNEAFARLRGLDPRDVPTEARDMGRPAEPPVATSRMLATGLGAATGMRASNLAVETTSSKDSAPKVVIFCLDWSCSMLSRDTRTPLSRFETCVKCVQRILQDQVRDHDKVGVVCFGPRVEVVAALTEKSTGYRAVSSKIQTLRPQTAGGTAFFDAVAQCLQMLNQPGVAPAEALKWLVCLTDGDDLGSRRDNTRGELVNQMLSAGIPANLNMVMITVGALRANNMKIIDGWVEKVSSTGHLGRHVSEKDAAAISKAFEVVAECLAAEVGGATEC